MGATEPRPNRDPRSEESRAGTDDLWIVKIMYDGSTLEQADLAHLQRRWKKG